MRIKTIALILSISAFGLFVLASPSFAAVATDGTILENLGQAGRDPFGAPASGRSLVSPGDLVGTLVNVAFGFVGTIAFAFLVYAGFLWLTARGSSEQVDTAKTYIRNSVIGIVVLILAYAFTYWVIDLIYDITT